MVFDILGQDVIKLLTNADSIQSCVLSVMGEAELSVIMMDHDQPKYRVKATSALWAGKINLIWVYISPSSSTRQGH